ncbi:hypothetical protein HNP84_005028 [Thermocatellispora tengchongensis]|uniref:Restriction endonuclease domain-containing protein n=1 Tax=Thermocatellispora tengchongensis TaxID=1073253 RepID=A0A840P7K8_9ACTN|nr:Uma2 family endonuclease [Thermocatellispora tengchongensis]MBB5135292.1 hypothetical protein [Thermocatellispora tengchongensis]
MRYSQCLFDHEGPQSAPHDHRLRSHGLILVSEIVSPGSVTIDRERKPALHARGGVPLFLLVDPVAEPAAVTLFGDLRDGRYQEIHTVAVGAEV